MGLLNKLFASKPVDFASPMQGEIITIDQVKDEVFSSKAVDRKSTRLNSSH